MSIPLYKPYLPAEIRDFGADTMECGWLGYGSRAQKLEQEFIDRFGGWALAVTSCTASLHLAARCLKQTDEDEVIIPAMTFVSTGMAFRSAGYRVVCADVDSQGLISLESARSLITPKTRAIVVVHLYGQHVPMEEFRSLCDEKGIYLVEDCAHRVGLDDKDHCGDLCCFSFNVMKELPSGEGGLLWGRNLAFESRARAYANVGLEENTVQRTSGLKHSNYLFGTEYGLKFLQNDIIAGLTLKLMTLFESNRSRRRDIFDGYKEILSKYQEFRVFDRAQDDSCLMFVVRLDEEYVEAFRDHLAKRGIATSHHYPSLSEHPQFERRVPCTQALKFEKEIVSLPCFVEMTNEQFEEIRTAILEFAELKGFVAE